MSSPSTIEHSSHLDWIYRILTTIKYYKAAILFVLFAFIRKLFCQKIDKYYISRSNENKQRKIMRDTNGGFCLPNNLKLAVNNVCHFRLTMNLRAICRRRGTPRTQEPSATHCFVSISLKHTIRRDCYYSDRKSPWTVSGSSSRSGARLNLFKCVNTYVHRDWAGATVEPRVYIGCLEKYSRSLWTYAPSQRVFEVISHVYSWRRCPASCSDAL